MQSSQQLHILVVEDNPGDFFLVNEYLSDLAGGRMIRQAERLTTALALVQNHFFDIVLLDLSLPDSSGVDSVRKMLENLNSTPLIVLTGPGNEKFGIDSLKLGAQDYLIKDEINASLLKKSVQYSIERSRVRQEMNRQDRLFRVITENSLVAKTLIAPDGLIKFCTSSIKFLTGFESIEYVGKNERDLLHPEDVDLMFENIARVVANPDSQPKFELRVKHKEGGYRWCEKSIVNLLHDEHVNALVCTSWDITERRLINERLASSEHRFRSLVQTGADMIALLDVEGVYEYVSDTVTNILGFTPGDLTGKNVWQLIHPDDLDTVHSQYLQLEARKQMELRPFRFKNKAGEWRWIETIVTNLLDEPSVSAYVANSRDITDKLRGAEELKKLSLIAKETTNAVIITDAEGITTWVNDAFTTITGYSFDEVVGKKPGALLQGRNSDKATAEIISKKLAAREPFEAEIINYTKEGKEYWVYIQGQPLFDERGEFVQFFAIETDITEQIMLERALETERWAKHQEITEAVISAQEKERHQLGIELHDNINQILASSRLYLGLAMSEQKDKLFCLNESDRLLNVAITEIRSLSHSLIPPSLNHTSLREAIEQVISVTRSTTGIRSRQEIRNLKEDSLPEKLKLAIYRIVQEQFNNIVKYAKASMVVVGLTQNQETVTLHITDDGKGFDTAARQEGVGLKNMKTRASLFNGEMKVLSSPGNGCTVEVIFRIC